MSTRSKARYMPRSPLLFLPTGFVPTAEQQLIQGAQHRVTLIKANAGAAKTTTLALRIGEALARGLAPDAILALVFTDQARDVMRERLTAIGIAPSVARRVTVQTVDAYAASVLAKMEDGTPTATLSDEDFRSVVLEAQEAVANRAGQSEDYLDIRTHNLALSELQATMLRLKATMALNQDLTDMPPSEAALTLDVPLADYLTILAYEEIRLGSFDAVQFRAMHDATYDLARALEQNPESTDYLGRYTLVLADELHDLNEAAFLVLQGLLDRDGTYFVGAGDRDQVIHAHLGANDAFLAHRFADRYPGCAHLPLTTTWRHGPHLAYAMQAFKNKPVDSLLAMQTVINLAEYDSATTCANRVVAALQQWKQAKQPLDQCAVLLRERHQSIAIENALMHAGIAYRTDGMRGYMARDEILFLRGMVAIALQNLAAIESDPVRRSIVAALALFAEVPLTPTELTQAQADIAAEPGLLAFFFSGQIQRVGSPQARSRMSDAVAYLTALPADTPAYVALTELCRRLDVDAIARRLYLVPRDADVVTRSVAGFIEAAREAGTSLRDFSEWLGAIDRRGATRQTRQAVLLDCVANAKGKEFDYVLMPFLQVDEFPRRDAPHHEEENLFYVGATRARVRLTLFVPTAPEQHSPFVAAMQLSTDRARANVAVEKNRAHDRALQDAAARHAGSSNGVGNSRGIAGSRGTDRNSSGAGAGNSRIGSNNSANRSPGSSPNTHSDGRVDLRVSYADKDIVKAMGALWDPVRKTWYVKAGVDPAPFSGWFA